MYNDAILSCSISPDEPPPEAQERSEDRLGGPPAVPELAPAAARAQRAAMANAHLNLEERIEMEAALRAGDTQAIIAIRLARSAGTISRELALNGGPRSYRATEAHRAAQGRRGAARRGDCAIDEHPPAGRHVGRSPGGDALGHYGGGGANSGSAGGSGHPCEDFRARSGRTVASRPIPTSTN